MTIARTPEERDRIRRDTLDTMRRPARHTHQWGSPVRAGVFDPTIIRICQTCGTRRSRKPKP